MTSAHPSPGRDTPYQLEETIGFLLGRLKHRMTLELDEELKHLDISAAQWVILMRIATGMVKTSAELCRCFSYDTGSMTRMLDRLEEKGLISRHRSAADRRVVELALSEAGHQSYPELKACGRRLADRMLQGISETEVDLFKSLIRRMQANLEHKEV